MDRGCRAGPQWVWHVAGGCGEAADVEAGCRAAAEGGGVDADRRGVDRRDADAGTGAGDFAGGRDDRRGALGGVEL